MQKLNYNYRSDVTYIATLDLLLGAFQLRVTLLLSKFFEYYFCYVHVYDQEYVLSQQKDNNLILMFTLKRFRNVFIQRLKILMFVCKHFFFHFTATVNLHIYQKSINSVELLFV